MSPNQKLRNIGISAHIDAGKTTISERILFYTGKIHQIHEVKGDEEGATMDYMELEKEKGITITSAAITCFWNDTQINLIDTPGHVDFTIEVERSLRVLDGGIMVLCGVGGVQSQSYTVDRQMKRYGIPRIAFINKLDRVGANPFRVIKALKDKLNLNPILLQYPIGKEEKFKGIIDLIEMVAYTYEGEHGETKISQPIPEELQIEAQQAREQLLDSLSLLSDEMTEKLLLGEDISKEMIIDVIRQGTLNLELTPVLLGTALKNKGIQDLLDAVNYYLPSPFERDTITATDINTNKPIKINPELDGNVVALAFKLIEDDYGQLTYTRLYSGTINKGDHLYNPRTKKNVRVTRLVRIEVNKRQELDSASVGEIIGLMGVNCASGDTLSSINTNLSLEGIQVPEPVITLSITPKNKQDEEKITKALHRFSDEDPTFKVKNDPESNNILISGMGELHLEIYLERMRREYKADVYVGTPAVAYRETITQGANFDYTLNKEIGKIHFYAKIEGRLEPCKEPFIFENNINDHTIPNQFIPACEQGFKDAMTNGYLKGYPIVGVKVILESGEFNSRDSSEMAFRLAAKEGFEQGFFQANPTLLEPMMLLEIETPDQFVGQIQSKLLSRRALLLESETRDNYTVIKAEVPLSEMLGYATELRSLSQGMATFSMELTDYHPLPNNLLTEIQ
ncbi:elongation factor G [Crocosphaera sp. XPORK-15E]|uniref:elongation factor G n=1 Tax=Crocosphaera sp. XPORK-15E TaxID=3110247 RepID=UPI002B1EE12E|nr:elongation factor G [Crocosphaera sp. XPORK-15E]MEA5536438.1 elongation factor G [Crocosphaera sp. XPORK-15E]